MALLLVSLLLVAAQAQLSCPNVNGNGNGNVCEDSSSISDTSDLMQRVQPVPPAVKLRAGARAGKLVLVGSGIKGVGHFTLEGLGHVEAADIVYYAVADPTTELFIQEHAKKSIDLYNLYGNGKPRRDTYTQMAEKLLESLRDGKYVVGVFYGHPGIFVSPAHRALQIAWLEGFDAQMLPGVSAIDCMSADLSVDPSRPGLQILEATDLLLRERTLFTDGHVVLFQVGSVGDMGFNFTGFKDTKFPMLVKKLEEIYGEDHQLTHYIAPQFSIVDPRIDRFTIRELWDPKVQKKINGISTFYIPPKTLKKANAVIAAQLGLRLTSKESKPLAGPFHQGSPYSTRDLKAIEDLKTHKLPQGYKATKASKAAYELLRDLALKPHMLHAFRRNPVSFLKRNAVKLTEKEEKAILSRHAGRLRMMMKDDTNAAEEFVQAVYRSMSFAKEWAKEVTSYIKTTDPTLAMKLINSWLEKQGYDTTFDQVLEAFTKARDRSLNAYTGLYTIYFTDGSQISGQPSSLIGRGVVKYLNKTIQRWSFVDSVLTWNMSSGNAQSAKLTFIILTNKTLKALPANAYVGPQFSGAISSTAPTIASLAGYNAYGCVGSNSIAHGGKIHKPIPANTVNGTPLSQYSDTYQVFLLSAGQTPKETSFELVVNAVPGAPEASAKISYDKAPISGFRYNNNVLSWTASGNLNSAYLLFYYNAGTPKDQTIGNQCIGSVWDAGSPRPKKNNVYCQLGSGTPTTPNSNLPAAQVSGEMIGINLAVGTGSMLVAEGIMKLFKTIWKAIKSGWSRPAQEEVQAQEEESEDDLESWEDILDQGTEFDFESDCEVLLLFQGEAAAAAAGCTLNELFNYAEESYDDINGGASTQTTETETETETSESESESEAETETETETSESESEVEAESDVDVDVEIIADEESRPSRQQRLRWLAWRRLRRRLKSRKSRQ